MKNTGTLIGAPVRVNDDQDTYPSAIDNEIKGGKHSVNSTADRDNIPAERRSPGMECYCVADGNTYELANDLVTWSLSKGSAGGSTSPGSGGNSATVTLISGNFGVWTSINNRAAQFVDQIELKFKSDLQAFPTRAITFLQGQFSLDPAFVGTTLALGTLPVNSQPVAIIKQYLIVANIELYLEIDTAGNISLNSKDGINLPVNNADAPYCIYLFFNPVIAGYVPTIYTAHRAGNFTRNNCGSGQQGSTIAFAKDYTSTIDQATADNLANANFNTDGQNFANDPANGATCTVVAPLQFAITNNAPHNNLDFDFYVSGVLVQAGIAIAPNATDNQNAPASGNNANVLLFINSGYVASSATLTKGATVYNAVIQPHLPGGISFANVDLSAGGPLTIQVNP